MLCGDTVAGSLKGFSTHGNTGYINVLPPKPMK